MTFRRSVVGWVARKKHVGPMNHRNANQNLVSELEPLLSRTMPMGEWAYVGAEMAFVLGRMVGHFIARETEFVDFLSCVLCSVSLRADLMRDVRPRWGQLSRMQGRYSRTECDEAVATFAGRSDLENANVPPSLIPLITKLLSPEPGGIMADIPCGRGLVMARALAEDEELTAEGVDINPRRANFAEMLVSPYAPRAGAYCGAAFDFMADHMWKYDKVFCYPPMGMRMDRQSQWKEFQAVLPEAFPEVGMGCRSELLYALAVLAAMKETGRAVVLLPEVALANQTSGAFAARDYLARSGYLDCVISLPGRMLERSQVGMALLVLARKEERRTVRMVDATGLGKRGRRFDTLPPDTATRIVNAVYGFGNPENWNSEHCKDIPLVEILEKDCNLSAHRHFEKRDVPNFPDAVRFGDVLEEVERGANVSSGDLDELLSEDEGVCRYLVPGDIDTGVVSSRLPSLKMLPPRAPVLQEGDLLLVRTGSAPKIAVFEDIFGGPVVPSANLFVCRLRRDRVDPWYLRAFFESGAGKTLLASVATGSFVRSISLASLSEMRIPLPPLFRQREIGGIFRTKFRRYRELRAAAEEEARGLADVFPAETERAKP